MIATTLVPPAPRIAVDHVGDGELVVFLHGIGGNRGNWTTQLEALVGACGPAVPDARPAVRFRAAAWDARGYGDSDDYDGPLRFVDLAADLARVLDAFGATRAHLVGLSMGGIVAQDFYWRQPARVRSLTLVDTSLGLREGQDTSWIEEFLRVRREPLLAGKTPADIAPGIARGLVGPSCTAEALASATASIAALHRESYLKTLETVTRHVNRFDPERVTVPTLVVVGADDTLLPPRVSRSLAAKIPGAELAVIAGAGHLPNIERPAEFNRVVIDFLCRASRRSG